MDSYTYMAELFKDSAEFFALLGVLRTLRKTPYVTRTMISGSIMDRKLPSDRCDLDLLVVTTDGKVDIQDLEFDGQKIQVHNIDSRLLDSMCQENHGQGVYRSMFRKGRVVFDRNR